MNKYFILTFFSIISQLTTLTNCVQIEFQITKVPKYYTPLNDNLFIAGSFNNWTANDSAYALTRTSFDTFRFNLELQPGYYEYKFTRGSWSTNETDTNGKFLPNRQLQINSDTESFILNITIQNWNDMKGNHTASGNVYYLDSHFPYPQFNRTKRIWIYLPADYFSSTNSTYSVVYMSDGQNVFDVFYNPGGREWGVDETLEYFYAQGFETSIVVGVETEGSGLKGQRVVELTPWPNEVLGGEGGGGDLFLDFLINNVKPYIDAKFRTKPDRINTALIGSSLGGLFNIYAGLKFQPVFGKIGSFSPAFIFNPQIYDFASNQTQMFDDFKVYFVCGAKEWLITVVPDMLRMYYLLAEKSYANLNYAINPNGEHNEDFWKVEFPDAYKWIFNLP